MRMACNFPGKEQAGGMSDAKIGGIGALAGGVLGGGLKGAAQGGALALKAWRERQAEQGVAAPAEEPTAEEVQDLTDDRTGRLVLQAMIGASQANGQVDAAEMEKILGHVSDGEATEAERAEAREAVSRPVDVEEIGRQISRPAAATEIHLAALLAVDVDAVDVDTEAERDCLRRLAAALGLDADMVRRLHRMTGAPADRGRLLRRRRAGRRASGGGPSPRTRRRDLRGASARVLPAFRGLCRSAFRALRRFGSTAPGKTALAGAERRNVFPGTQEFSIGRRGGFSAQDAKEVPEDRYRRSIP